MSNPYYPTSDHNDVFNVYPAGGVPFEAVSSMPSMPHNSFEDLISHVNGHRRRHGKQEHSRMAIRQHFHKKGSEMGLSPPAAEGFFGDLWNGIKSVGSNILGGLGNVVSKVASDPLGAIGSIAPLLA